MRERNIFVRLAIKNRGVRNERGATAVEFAIVLPLLLFLVFAIIEFALLLYNKAMVTNAARAGARTGLVFRANGAGDYDPFTTDQIRTVVNNYLASHLLSISASTTFSPPVINPCPQPDPDNPNAVREIQVTADVTFTFVTLPDLSSLLRHGTPPPPSGSGFPLSVPLTGQSVMNCE